MSRYISPNDYKLLKEKYPKNIEEVLRKIDNNYPIQYLIGNVSFYGYTIMVNENCLIPRYETEGLVEKLLSIINSKKIKKDNLNIIDVGTGSGCIAICLAKELDIPVSALDINPKSIEIAKENALLNKVDVTFIESDIRKFNPDKKYNILVSNPPYVDINEEVDPAIKYEPSIAIYSQNRGTKDLEDIIRKSKTILDNKNIIALEMGASQGEYLKEIASEVYPKGKTYIYKDLSNRDRYFFIINE